MVNYSVIQSDICDSILLSYYRGFPQQFDLTSLSASDKSCRLLINFESSLNPDQDQQNLGPLMVCMDEVFDKVDFEK